MANSVQHKLYIVPETEYGVTPANPVFTEIPITGTTIGMTKNTLQSSTIRSDRQIVDFREGTQQVGGDINTELQWGAVDALIEAALCGAWKKDAPKAGTDQIKAGVTRRSFSVLRHFTDMQAADEPYELIRGVEIGNMALNITLEGLTTATFTVVGKDITSMQTKPAGATLNDVAAKEGFDSFSGSITENGKAIATATEMSFTLENGLEPRFRIGAKTTLRPKIGKSNLTGQLGTYFENHELLKKFYGGTHSNIKFELANPAGNKYTFTIPRFLYSGGQPDVEGESDIILSMPLQATYESVAKSNIVIERKAA